MAVSTPTDFAVRTVTTLHELEPLRSFWSSLNCHPDVDIDFFSFLVRTELGVEKPFVLILGQSSKPEAILVGRLQQSTVNFKIGYLNLFKRRVRQITFYADGAHGYLGASSPQAARVFTEHILKLLATDIADRVVLFKLQADSELSTVSRTMPGWLQRDHVGEVSPRWSMTVPPTFDDFLRKVSSKRRWQLRNILRVIEKANEGRIVCKKFQKQPEIPYFCADAERIARHTYQRGLGAGFMNTDSDRQRLELWAEKGWLKAYILYAAEKPIAFWSGIVYKNVWYSIWTGYDPAHQKHHPGTVLLLKILEDQCGSNVTKIDFGFGQAEYKERFGDQKQVQAFINIHAPTLSGVSLGLLASASAFINHSAKAIMDRLKVLSRIKRFWRRRLANVAAEQQPKSEA